MNEKLPIVVKASRLVWGILALGAAGLFILMITSDRAEEEWTTAETLVAFVFFVLFGLMAPVAAWISITAPSIIVVDENGVNGRLSLFKRMKIPWEDIVGADFRHDSTLIRTGGENTFGGQYFSMELRYLRLFVDNTSGKYHRASRSPDEAKAPGEERDIRVIEFTTNLSNASEGRTQEIAGVIDNLAKTTLAERQKMTKSPFAANE